MESETQAEERTREPEYWLGVPQEDPVLRTTLLESVPDRPRYVRARGLLLGDACQVVLGPEGRRGAGFFVGDPRREGPCQAIGRPVAGLVAGLLAHCATCRTILIDAENAEHFASLLPSWNARPATVHVHPDPASIPAPAAGASLLTAEELRRPGVLDAFEPEECETIRDAVGRVPIAAVWADGVVASFCYAPHGTESWWELDGATARPFRRRGHGRAAAGFLIQRMIQERRRPMWAALDGNEASRRMAVSSGFRAVDRMVLLEPPDDFVCEEGCE